MESRQKVYKDREEWVLIEKCKKGDSDAFDELFRRYQTRVFNTILHYLGDFQESQDICQEVFVHVFRAIKSFRGESSFFTWLYRIAVNLTKNRFKKKNREKKIMVQPVDQQGESFLERLPMASGATPEKEFQDKSLNEAIQKGLMGLNPEQRMVLVLREIQGMSYEDIARVLKISQGTVKSRVARGRTILQKNLKRYL